MYLSLSILGTICVIFIINLSQSHKRNINFIFPGYSEALWLSLPSNYDPQPAHHMLFKIKNIITLKNTIEKYRLLVCINSSLQSEPPM